MKIAFCLSGLVGHENKYGSGKQLDPKIAFDYYNKNIFSINNVDIYIHTWSVNQEKNLKEIYHPYKIKAEINDNKNNIDTRLFSIQSRWKSNKIVLDMVDKNKYDFVMITRFDILFKKQLDFKLLNKDNFYILGPDPIHKYSKKHNNKDCCNKNSKYYEINDLWFVSNYQNMINFTRAFDNLPNLIKETTLSNHTIAAQQLRNIELFNNIEPLFEQKLHESPGDGDSPLIRWI